MLIQAQPEAAKRYQQDVHDCRPIRNQSVVLMVAMDFTHPSQAISLT
jgi:hypothetical protein